MRASPLGGAARVRCCMSGSGFPGYERNEALLMSAVPNCMAI